MSNPVTPPAGLGIARPAVTDSSPGRVTSWVEEFDLPNGESRTVAVRVGSEGDPQAEEVRAAALRRIDVHNHTGALEREVARLRAEFDEITHFDRHTGQPVYRVSGDDRRKLELKLAGRIRSLECDRVTVQEAAALQRAERQAEEAKHVRIREAAEKRAVEILEEEDIERQAQLLARRSGGR